MNMIPNGGGKSKNETPLYATLLYDVIRELDISIAEYFYLDMVYHLSHSGWCYKSLDSIARDMNMAKSGVVKLRDRLIGKKLIKKSIKGHVKTTDMYHKVIRSDSSTYHKVNKPYYKVERNVPLSDTKNNNRITRDKEAYKKENGSGYAQAKAMRQKLSAVMSTS